MFVETINKCIMKVKFKKSFEKRLFALAKAIELYRQTGNPNNVMPFLWLALSFAYCNDVFVKNRNKQS